jgi:hypothetical protein
VVGEELRQGTQEGTGWGEFLTSYHLLNRNHQTLAPPSLRGPAEGCHIETGKGNPGFENGMVRAQRYARGPGGDDKGLLTEAQAKEGQDRNRGDTGRGQGGINTLWEAISSSQPGVGWGLPWAPGAGSVYGAGEHRAELRPGNPGY